MKVEYLKKYEKNINNLQKAKRNPVEPCSLEEIVYLEEKLNEGEFLPKSFREYLYIGGNYSGLPHEITYKSMHGTTIYVKEKLAERGIKINRPFVVFDELDNSCFSFIYLDEGDNPQPWNCSINEAYDSDEDEIIWKIPFATFKDEIEKMVELGIIGVGL